MSQAQSDTILRTVATVGIAVLGVTLVALCVIGALVFLYAAWLEVRDKS